MTVKHQRRLKGCLLLMDGREPTNPADIAGVRDCLREVTEASHHLNWAVFAALEGWEPSEVDAALQQAERTLSPEATDA